MKKIKFLLVFLPLLTGALIYLLYRSKNLYYYNFIHFLVIYSLPDGLWLFSVGAVFLIARKRFFLHVIWFFFIYLLVILGEFVQKFFGGHGTPVGTFDKSDIVAFTYAYISINVVAIILRFFQNKDKYIFKNSKEILENICYTIIISIVGLLANMF